MAKTLSLSDENYSTRMLSVSRLLKAASKEVLYQAGENLASEEFQGSVAKDLNGALSLIAEFYTQQGLGRLVMNGAETGFLLVRNYDCATCSVAENDGQTYCWIDAGFIAGALRKMLGTDFVVIETKCRGTGSEYCEFLIAKSRTPKRG